MLSDLRAINAVEFSRIGSETLRLGIPGRFLRVPDLQFDKHSEIKRSLGGSVGPRFRAQESIREPIGRGRVEACEKLHFIRLTEMGLVIFRKNYCY